MLRFGICLGTRWRLFSRWEVFIWSLALWISVTSLVPELDDNLLDTLWLLSSLCVFCFDLFCYYYFLLLKATLTVMWHPFLQVLLNQLEFGMNPQQALDQPRICLEDVDRLVLIDSKLLKHLLINCAASVLTIFFSKRAAWVCIKWACFPSRLAYTS